MEDNSCEETVVVEDSELLAIKCNDVNAIRGDKCDVMLASKAVLHPIELHRHIRSVLLGVYEFDQAIASDQEGI